MWKPCPFIKRKLRKKEEIGERFRSEIDIEGIVFLFEVGHALCEALKVALLAAHTHIAALSSSYPCR